MPLLIPYAAPLSDAGRLALQTLPLPHLAQLLAQWREVNRDEDEPTSLSAPHERALARALGWTVADGRLPWAAREAQAADLDGGPAWGRLTPVHLLLGSDEIQLTAPEDLALDEAESRALFDVLSETFTSEGFRLAWRSPLCWLLGHASLAELPTASLDRAVGRHLERWLPEAPQARLLRRLLNEAQMLLHGQPVNDAREARGLPAVNSLWLDGCGPAQPATPPPAGLQVDDRLRRPALSEDWGTWQRAWIELDAGPIAELLRTGGDSLVLCGERTALTLQPQRQRWWQALTGGARRRPAAPVLEAL